MRLVYMVFLHKKGNSLCSQFHVAGQRRLRLTLECTRDKVAVRILCHTFIDFRPLLLCSIFPKEQLRTRVPTGFLWHTFTLSISKQSEQ